MAIEQWKIGAYEVSRDALGKFTKKVIPAELHYAYLISFDYKNRGKKGFHPFHAEVLVTSPIELEENEVIDFALENSEDFANVFASCEMKVKGMERRIGFLPTTTYKMLKYKH